MRSGGWPGPEVASRPVQTRYLLLASAVVAFVILLAGAVWLWQVLG